LEPYSLSINILRDFKEKYFFLLYEVSKRTDVSSPALRHKDVKNVRDYLNNIPPPPRAKEQPTGI